MTAVAEVFPTFVRHNKGQPNLTGLPMSAVSQGFFDDEGPDLLGKYAPWAVDIMPLPTWIQLFVGVLGAVQRHGAVASLPPVARRRGPREDRARDSGAVRPGRDRRRIAEIDADARHATPEARAQLDDVIGAPRRARGTLPQALAVGAGADGRGDVLPLPGDADLRPAARAAHLPGQAAAVTRGFSRRGARRRRGVH